MCGRNKDLSLLLRARPSPTQASSWTMAPAIGVGVGEPVALRVMLRAGSCSPLIQGMASGAESRPPKLLGPQTCPSGTAVQPRPSMAPVEHPGISTGRRVAGRKLGRPRPGPQPGPQPQELSCETEAPRPFLINKVTSPNQHTHTEARCQPSVRPPILLPSCISKACVCRR